MIKRWKIMMHNTIDGPFVKYACMCNFLQHTRDWFIDRIFTPWLVGSFAFSLLFNDAGPSTKVDRIKNYWLSNYDVTTFSSVAMIN